MIPSHTDVTGPEQLHDHSACQRVNQVLSRIGDKWSVLIVMLLGDGPLRFNELKKRIGRISQRMLTLTLRGLERDGLVTRTVTPKSPASRLCTHGLRAFAPLSRPRARTVGYREPSSD